jgi:hypothetical protein
LPREECKKPNTSIWKAAMWGTERDFSFILRLNDEKKIESLLTEYEWRINAGVGFQTSRPCDKLDKEIQKIPHIEAKNVNRYFTSVNQTKKIQRTLFRRFGCMNAYKAPHIVIKRGQEKKRFCSAYLDYSCSFQDILYGIHIENGEKELKLLSCFLNAQIASYLMFLTTASWGIEREEVKPNEVLNLPNLTHLLKEEKKQAIIACIDEIITIKKSNDLSQDIKNIEQRIDELFYEGLNLSTNERVLIEDLVSLTLDGFQNKKESIAFRPCDAVNMQQYSIFLSNTINNFLKFGSTLRGWISVFVPNAKMPLNIVALHLNNQQQAGYVEMMNDYEISQLFKEIEQYTYQQFAESIYYRKFLKYYAGDTIYIIKPNEKRFWSRSLAMNEADEIIAEILSGQKNAK